MEKNNKTLDDVRLALANNFKSLQDTINNMLKGTDFNVADTDVAAFSTTVELVIINENGPKTFNPSLLTLRLDEDEYRTQKGRKFTTNIDTIGSFDLFDNNISSRTNFYINVGKLLGDKNNLANIANSMYIHAVAIRELRRQIYELKKEYLLPRP